MMDVRTTMKFGISAGNVYTQCNLGSHKKHQAQKKHKGPNKESSMIESSKEQVKEKSISSRPP